jgi:ferric-dicitrate binding protein FerR (iron transport regulator)
MDCEQVQSFLVADMDRELPRADRAHLEEHLRACAACRATAEAYRLQDAELRLLFAPRRQAVTRVASRVIADLRLRPTRTRRRVPWIGMVVSAAAGFLLALAIFRPWDKSHVSVPTSRDDSPSPALSGWAQLAIAKQAIEIQLPGQNAWQPLKSGGQVPIGTRVRTPAEVCCEFTTVDGSEIRLNGGTELVFSALRQLNLTQGQIMARVAPGSSPFEVSTPESLVSALAAEFDLLCQPTETLLLVLQGTIQVGGKQSSQKVQSGERATIVQGRVAKTESIAELNQVMLTRWVNEILMLKGRDNPELAKRVNDLLAQLGGLKGQFMDESEIRGLGDRCVLPLTRFLQSPRSEGSSRRQMVAHIIADLAPAWSIPDLIDLLKDQDGEVRFYAASGLRRLTGEVVGLQPEEWRQADAKTRLKAYRQWKSWWQENKHRYPGVS